MRHEANAVGWTSMYEDILERMSDAVYQLRNEVPADVSRATEANRLAIDRAMGVLFKLIKEAEACLELGTDPALDAPAALHQTRVQLRTVEDQLTDAVIEIKRLKAALQSTQRECDLANNEVAKLRIALESSNGKIEELISQNPAAAYAMYSRSPKR